MVLGFKAIIANGANTATTTAMTDLILTGLILTGWTRTGWTTGGARLERCCTSDAYKQAQVSALPRAVKARNVKHAPGVSCRARCASDRGTC
eukprot:1468457-Prymnesium_polylepis.1